MRSHNPYSTVYAADVQLPEKTIVMPSSAIPPFEEHFTSAKLDMARWVLTRKNDFHESTIDVIGTKEAERRLRLRADTMGTNENTIKYHGIRTLNPVINIQHPTEVKLDLDWNHPDNGSYMTAGFFICPTATNGNPEDESEWIKVIYNGVFPGKNARIEITVKNKDQIDEYTLFDEGWKGHLKEFLGRTIGLQHLRLVLSQNDITIWENDKKLSANNFKNIFDSPLTWTTAYLYLQQSNQCNYHALEVYFNNIMIRQTTEQPIERMGPKLTTQPVLLTTPPSSPPGTPFYEKFSTGQLDWTRWVITRKNDFNESTMDIVGANETDRRLCLHADTRGTDENTVKYHGVRMLHPLLDIQHPTEIKLDIDWNHPSNGCYMTAGLLICPTATIENPEDEPNWVQVVYHGVFPGKKVRIQVFAKKDGNIARNVFDEGWGNAKNKGIFENQLSREPGLQHLRIVLSQQSIAVWENDKMLCDCSFIKNYQIAASLAWSTAYLYLQQSTICNYPAREVFFGNISIKQL